MGAKATTILLVEDEVDVRVLIAEMLGDAGYTVIEAGGGPEALTAAEKVDYQFDLLMTDVIMPGMNGPELAEELGKVVPDLRVLYMSGYTDKAFVESGVLEENLVFLDKPFAGDVMLGKVRDALAREPQRDAT